MIVVGPVQAPAALLLGAHQWGQVEEGNDQRGARRGQLAPVALVGLAAQIDAGADIERQGALELAVVVRHLPALRQVGYP